MNLLYDFNFIVKKMSFLQQKKKNENLNLESIIFWLNLELNSVEIPVIVLSAVFM